MVFGGLVAHDVELAAEQVVHGRTSAAIGNAVEGNPELVAEHRHAQMRGRADAGMAVIHLFLLAPHPIKKLADIRNRQVRRPTMVIGTSAMRPIWSKSSTTL